MFLLVLDSDEEVSRGCVNKDTYNDFVDGFDLKKNKDDCGKSGDQGWF